eukprot:879093_1
MAVHWLSCCVILHLLNVVKGAIYSTDIIWSTYHRPTWSGNVSINYTEPEDQIPGQIWKVEGIVLPISTSGRPSSSNPYNGYPTGGATGLDRGHLMALSIGGPNINFNIVPQSSQWQQSGGWKQMEDVIYNYAKFKYGWNTISHASEAQNIAKPNSCNVIFIVEPLIYNE